MRRLKIAIDVDDVLAANAAGVVEFSNQRWGTSLTIDDYDEHWAKMWGIDLAELERRIEEFYASGAQRHYGHIGGSREVLTQLSRHHQLVIATSRRLYEKADTLAWIDEHFPGIFTSSAVYFSGAWDKITTDSHMLTKADLISQIEADVLIDDQLKHCVAVAETGRYAIVFGDYEWNRANHLPPRVVRCLSWIEVERTINEIAQGGVLKE
ncbi:MAG: 5' nucleotidase, NT5C type [Candidatus Nanosyncoccaceae bacterium]|jgi:5'(3')-deoxyribonucleotidase